MQSPVIPICNEEKPPTPTSAGSPPPPLPVPFEWSMELTAELMESIIMDGNSDSGRRVFQVNHKSLFAPLKVFACYHQFCKRAFNGNPPKECTIAEYERKMLEVLPPFLCKNGDGPRTLF